MQTELKSSPIPSWALGVGHVHAQETHFYEMGTLLADIVRKIYKLLNLRGTPYKIIDKAQLKTDRLLNSQYIYICKLVNIEIIICTTFKTNIRN